MKRIQKLELVSQPFSLVRSWRRWVGRVESLYARRVLAPVRFWRENGSRPESLARIRLPWWHRFVYAFLVMVGRSRRPRRLRPGEPLPVPRVIPGARVFYIDRLPPMTLTPRQQQRLAWQRFEVEWELRRAEQRYQRWRR
jgi:hypothetical protein